MTKRTVTLEDFIKDAEVRFGTDKLKWRFVCPACGHVASVQDYKDVGAPEGDVGFSCIGRYYEIGIFKCRPAFADGPGPCDYTTGGLFNISPVEIVTPDGEKHYRFELADNE